MMVMFILIQNLIQMFFQGGTKPMNPVSGNNATTLSFNTRYVSEA